MKYFGGYFELELSRGGKLFHRAAIPLSTGRACLVAIIQQKKPCRVHVPFYICDAALRPMRKARIPIRFYGLDKSLAPVGLSVSHERELILAVNFFGLRTAVIDNLARCYADSFVADNSQAFFDKPGPGYWAFFSARKFFGVPDGAYLYTPEPVSICSLPNSRSDIRHLVNRLVGRQQTGYRQFQRSEKRIDGRVRAMSRLSERMLDTIDYDEVARRRVANYQSLHALLGRDNLFEANLPVGATPFAYPFLPSHPVDRARLASEGLYVPTLWPEVTKRKVPGFNFERQLVKRLLPLPIDHRYEPAEMIDVAERLKRVLVQSNARSTRR